MSCRTNCCKKLSLILALLALAVLAVPAFAQSANNCLQDEFTAGGNSQTVNCTANDVRLAAVKDVHIISGGVGDKCLAGAPFSFIADFEVLTTAKSSRSNIGIYFGTGTGPGQNGAKSGTCSDAIISPANSDNYHELDSATPTDNCGDTSSTDVSPTFGAGAEGVTIEVDNVTCPLTGNSLSLPECTSWQVPGKTLLCVSPGPNFPYQPTAIPGSPSKCNCGTLSIPVQPVTPTATVAKSCNTTASQGSNLVSCDAGAEGSTVTYHVAITNTSNIGGIVVDQICDSRYGNVFTAPGFTPACPAGDKGTATNVNCPPADIAQGATGTCDFTAVQGELDTVTDTVTVKGHSDLVATSTFGPDTSNSVTVTSTDAASSATVTKGLDSLQAGCATARYSVDVHNSSGFDEDLTLTALTDSVYGNIIPNTASDIIGTTCTVPQPLPVGGADYTCTFDAQFCGALATITLPNGSTCLGLQHVNKVTGTINGDEGPGDVVTQTGNTLTVDVCFTSFTTSTTP